MKMRKSVKTRWLDALKSGEYEQGTGSLMFEDDSYYGPAGGSRYCCLGVLLDIEKCLEENPKERWHTEGMPTEKFLKVIGLDSSYAQMLANVNDDSDNFDDVIQMIEKEV
tara:strand:+ start:663 stop:992 length:330 start_codon:yes stop_codon:yes gene_type:complete